MGIGQDLMDYSLAILVGLTVILIVVIVAKDYITDREAYALEREWCLENGYEGPAGFFSSGSCVRTECKETIAGNDVCKNIIETIPLKSQQYRS